VSELVLYHWDASKSCMYSHTLCPSIRKVVGVQNSLSIKAPEHPAPSISSQPYMTSETSHSTICKRVGCQNSLSIKAPERPPPSIASYPYLCPFYCIPTKPVFLGFSHSPICKVARRQNCLFIKALERKILFKYVISHPSSLHV